MLVLTAPFIQSRHVRRRVGSMLFETLGHVPRWRDYYLAHDQTSHYEYVATQLKALQFRRGGRRWLLKSPQHLEQLPVLDRVFPGAVVVFTHRDPVPVTLLMLAMQTYTARMHRSPVPVREIAASWVDRLVLMLGALVRDREVIPPDRSIDVRFDDFMANELGVAAPHAVRRALLGMTDRNLLFRTEVRPRVRALPPSRAHQPRDSVMGAAAYVGRVGGLAVALGVGAAVATGQGVASASPTDSTSPTSESTTQESQELRSGLGCDAEYGQSTEA